MRRAAIITMLLSAASASAQAQALRWVPHTGHYGAVSIGRHNLSLSCDSLCPSNPQATAFSFALGRQLSQRIRFELGADLGITSGKASTFLRVGLASYLVGGLHVRGAASWARFNLDDSLNSFTYSGGPGFMVGGGYDLPVGRTFAFTPYVNYVAGTAKAIDVTGGRTTHGTYHSLNFGVSLTRLAGMFECTTSSGEKVWARPRDRARALACLREVEARTSGSTGRIKL